MKTIIGIDNGLTGGLALIHPDGRVDTYVTPTIPGRKGTRVLDEQSMYKLLCDLEPNETHAWVEQVHFLPKQSSTAGGNYGIGHGLWRGILVGLQIPYTIVAPQTWQRALFTGDVCRRDTKQAASIVARRLFPGLNLRASERCRKDHDGMCDALLIAEYGRRQMRAAVGVLTSKDGA